MVKNDASDLECLSLNPGSSLASFVTSLGYILVILVRSRSFRAYYQSLWVISINKDNVSGDHTGVRYKSQDHALEVSAQ